MGRLSIIEERLKALNQAAFQELCDSYLSQKRIPYKVHSRTGSQAGKEKTTKGIPDSYFLLPDDTYIFIECTTQQTDLLKKLKEDVSNCLNETKTGVPISKVREIVLCFNSKLKAGDLEEFKKFSDSLSIKLPTLVTIDELAIQINLHHRNLAKEHLELSLDSGQIVSLDRFITQYNSAANGIATPIDNPLLHREKELEDVIDKINKSKFVIISGAPGVGKTKLATEAIQTFIASNLDYKAFAIANKHYDLLEDLPFYFEGSNNILFVDDANRLDRLLQIVGFSEGLESARLKIVLTVRDYALEQLRQHIPAHEVVDLESPTEEQIVDIIKNPPFGIMDSDFQDQILKISGTNPRLAIMAARLCLKEKRLDVLYDVFDLFNEYFTTYVQDAGHLKDKEILKTLGLISFFNVLPYSKKEVLGPILNKFDISIDNFVEAIDKLESLEFVEIKYDHVRISEQTISTFFFYKVVFNDELISFRAIIENYYDNYRHRLKDTIIPSNNTFGYSNVRNKIRPHLIAKLNSLSTDKELIDFYDMFWFYLEDEMFAWIYQKISLTQENTKAEYTNPKNSNSVTDEYLKLLFQVVRYHGDSSIIEKATNLAIEYSRKKPDSYGDLVNGLTSYFSFDYEDERLSFRNQQLLFRIIYTNIRSSTYIQVLFLHIVNKFLRFEYQQGKPLRGNQFSIYRYPLSASEFILNFRRQLWEHVVDLFETHGEKSFEVVHDYSQQRIDVKIDILKFDLNFIYELIQKHFKKDSFKHNFVVQEYCYWLRRLKVEDPRFSELAKTFFHPKYQVFRKLDMNRLRDKEMHDFDNYDKYKAIKESEIRTSFKFSNLHDFDCFIATFCEIVEFRSQDYEMKNSLGLVLDENVKANTELSLSMLKRILYNPTFEEFIPYSAITSIASANDDIRKAFWSLLKPESRLKQFLKKFSKQGPKPNQSIANWRLEYLIQLPKEAIDRKRRSELLAVIANINQPITLFLTGIEKYEQLYGGTIDQIVNTIVDLNQNKKGRIATGYHFFEAFGEFVNTSALKSLYKQQDRIQSFFDFSGDTFFIVLKRDPDFLIEYLEFLSEDPSYKRREDYGCIRRVWDLNNSAELVKQAVIFLLEQKRFDMDEIFEAFFINNKPEHQERADDFLLKILSDFKEDPSKVSPIFELIISKRDQLFQKAFIHYVRLNSRLEDFQKITWIETSVFHDGSANVGDIRASRWHRVLSAIDLADIGINAIPLQSWVKEQIESEQRSADRFREWAYLGKW